MSTNRASQADRAEPQTPTSKPGNRWLKVLALGIGSMAIVLVACVAVLWWWAGTDGSLARALTWVGQSQPLRFERASGSLRAGGRVEQLTWQQDGLTVQVAGLAVVWQPWSLLQRKLALTQLAADSVAVNDARPPPTEPPKPPTALGLPLAVVIDNFAVGQLSLTRPFAFSATAIAGRYEFDRLLHRLDLANAQVATGRYSGSAALASSSPLTLDARLSGALQTAVPGSTTPLALAFQATARGPITELLANAELQMAPQAAAGKNKSALQPQATATARILPWATQPLAAADATFRDLDVATLWPEFPQTQLTGSASVRPLSSSPGSKSLVEQAWQLQTNLTNKLPGPWDRQRLPLDSFEASGEWRSGTALVRALKATANSWPAANGLAPPPALHQTRRQRGRCRPR
jgi:translocation and assembly module TamB